MLTTSFPPCFPIQARNKNSNAFFRFFRRILLVDTADEFYCAMGQLSAEMMEFTKEDSDKLIKVFLIRT